MIINLYLTDDDMKTWNVLLFSFKGLVYLFLGFVAYYLLITIYYLLSLLGA